MLPNTADIVLLFQQAHVDHSITHPDFFLNISRTIASKTKSLIFVISNRQIAFIRNPVEY